MYRYNGKIIKGGPVELVTEMKEGVYDPDQFQSLDEYIKWLVSSIWRFEGKGINIQGESLEERCSSLVQQLVEHGLLEELK